MEKNDIEMYIHREREPVMEGAEEENKMMMQMTKKPVQDEPPLPTSLLLCLYVGHFLARWGARMWEFSVGLYMIEVWPGSLLLAAAYGVVESAATALFGPLVGTWVDSLTYVKVLQLWLLTQNLSFVVAGATMIVLLAYPDMKHTNFIEFMSLVIITNISGAVGVLSTLAGTILVEREWVVVISEGHPPEVLTKMNSVIRRIDLICKLFAPVVAGFIISFVSLKASAVALSLWNTISVFLQYWLLMSVYNGMQSLSERSHRRVSGTSPMQEDNPSTFQEERSLLPNAATPKLSENGSRRKISERILNIPYISAWRVYLRQEVVLPGTALALLFFNVLSFGTLMTAALQWEGTPAYVIGIARGVSASIGIAATFVYPFLQSHISTIRTGLWSIWSQWSCLLVCVASISVKNNFVSAYILMGGVAASRLGLWMFDLSVIQQMQDQVPEFDRIVVGGVQNSLQSVLDLMTYVVGVIISNPQDFWKLVMLSFVLVTVACGLYSLHVYRVRKHLIHFEKLPLLFPWLVEPSQTRIRLPRM